MKLQVHHNSNNFELHHKCYKMASAMASCDDIDKDFETPEEPVEPEEPEVSKLKVSRVKSRAKQNGGTLYLEDKAGHTFRVKIDSDLLKTITGVMSFKLHKEAFDGTPKEYKEHKKKKKMEEDLLGELLREQKKRQLRELDELERSLKNEPDKEKARLVRKAFIAELKARPKPTVDDISPEAIAEYRPRRIAY